MSPTRLTDLRISELSGVDEPANEAPGWLVAKAKEFNSDVQDLEKAVVVTHELLDSPELELYLADAPDVVAKSAELLRDHLADGLEEVEDEEPGDSLVEKIRGIFGLEKATGQPQQSILGATGATRSRVDRVTPAEAHEGDGGPEVTEDQGEDELVGGRQDISGTGKPEYDGEVAHPAGTQESLGAEAATRNRVDRITPAEAPQDPVKTDDQGADELGAPGAHNTSESADEETGHSSDPTGHGAADRDTSGGKRKSGKVKKDADGEEIAKAVGGAVSEALEKELGPIREVLGNIIDRQESLEKASALPLGLPGQDGEYTTPDNSLAGAVQKAALNPGSQVTLT